MRDAVVNIEAGTGEASPPLNPASARTETSEDSKPVPAQVLAAAAVSGMPPSVIARRVVAAILTVVMCWTWITPPLLSNLFQYHPLAMTLAFVAVAPEVIFAVRGLKKCRSMVERNAVMNRHLYLALAMKLLAVIGFAVIYVNKNKSNKSHFTTWHGLLGFLCVLAIVVQVVAGFVMQLRLGPTRRYPSFTAKLRMLHYYAGVSVVALGGIVVFLGMRSYYAEGTVKNPVVNTAFGLSCLVLCGWAFVRV